MARLLHYYIPRYEPLRSPLPPLNQSSYTIFSFHDWPSLPHPASYFFVAMRSGRSGFPLNQNSHKLSESIDSLASPGGPISFAINSFRLEVLKSPFIPPFPKGDFASHVVPPLFQGEAGGIIRLLITETTFGNCYKSSHYLRRDGRSPGNQLFAPGAGLRSSPGLFFFRVRLISSRNQKMGTVAHPCVRPT